MRLDPWRAVESQHQISTRKLVDSDAEQQVLEDLIESAKPPSVTTAGLHYLLFTPFRYPPLAYGSRFGSRSERGLWYGSETIGCAFAEVAYYRLVFLEGTTADLGLVEAQLTTFRASVRTLRGVDLTRPPFAAFEGVLTSRSEYRETQSLGRAMREAGVAAFRYRSARDSRGGTNVGILDPSAFMAGSQRDFDAWHCTASADVVEMTQRTFIGREVHTFSRADFLVDGVLPIPAV